MCPPLPPQTTSAAERSYEIQLAVRTQASNATHSTEENAMISLLNSDFFSPEILRQNGNHYECGRMPNSEGGGLPLDGEWWISLDFSEEPRWECIHTRGILAAKREEG